MYKNMLPLGTVVLLKGGQKRLMICGRVMTRAGEDKIYEYCGVYFPEGITDPKSMFFFDKEAIDRVFFLGYKDIEEQNYSEKVLGNLGELKVEDGKIVKKEQ